jgi:hypothetical protein
MDMSGMKTRRRGCSADTPGIMSEVIRDFGAFGKIKITSSEKNLLPAPRMAASRRKSLAKGTYS